MCVLDFILSLVRLLLTLVSSLFPLTTYLTSRSSYFPDVSSICHTITHTSIQHSHSTPISGDKQETRGTAFVVYEDIYDAKNAVEHLSGFNVCGRYLIVLYYQPTKMQKQADNVAKRKELDEAKARFGMNKEES
jgi:RNA recognition motif-containing protein